MLNHLHRMTIRVNGVADSYWKDWSYPCRNSELCPSGNCNNPNACDYSRMLERLAAYEDTKQRPEDVVKLIAKVKRLEARVRKYRLTIEKLEAEGVEIPRI